MRRSPRSQETAATAAMAAVALVAVAVASLCCGSGAERTAAERGEQVYRQNCIACHHPDPRLDGGVGPAVAGSSRALIEARVVGGEYPPGYTPKRETALMPAQPYLAPQVDDLAAYLSAVGSVGDGAPD